MFDPLRDPAPPILIEGLEPDRGPGAPCEWCGEPIPRFSRTGRRVRADAATCSKRCRQASWRFGHDGPANVYLDPGRPRRFAYADPPYPGMSRRYYEGHPDYAGEVDHAQLVEQLCDRYPDGWALSTSSKTLRQVLALIPPHVEVRIGAWTKPMPPASSQRPRRGWEPVIFHGGRPLPPGARMILDWIHAAPPRSLPGQVVGTKPSAFARWVFDSLGAQPGDQLHDLYPGSGAIGRAWDRYVAQDPVDASLGAGDTRRVAAAAPTADVRAGRDHAPLQATAPGKETT